MEEETKKKELTADDFRQIRYALCQKAYDWYIYSRKPVFQGMEVMSTKNKDKYVLKDIESGIMLGMKREVSDNEVLTKLTFFDVYDEDDPDNQDLLG